MKVYLSKDQMLYAQNEEEATAYIGMKILYDKMLTKDRDKIEVGFSLQTLYYEISGAMSLDKSTKAKLKNGVDSLIDAKAVDLIASDDKGNYIVNIAKLAIKKNEPYTRMTQEEIWKIYGAKDNAQMNLLRFGVDIYGTINSITKCGFASNQYLRDLSSIKSNKTVTNYIKVLEEQGLLYVRRCENIKRNADGTVNTLSNVYGRPEDYQDIDYFFEERFERLGHDFTNSMDSVRKARLTRNYNKFIAGSYKGDVVELIRECLTFNKLPYIEGKPEYEKDLTIFDAKDIEQAQEGLKDHIKEGKKEEKKMGYTRSSKHQEDNYDDLDDEIPF